MYGVLDPNWQQTQPFLHFIIVFLGVFLVVTPRTLTMVIFVFHCRDSPRSTSFAQPSGISLSPGNMF